MVSNLIKLKLSDKLNLLKVVHLKTKHKYLKMFMFDSWTSEFKQDVTGEHSVPDELKVIDHPRAM